jgi:hypothetical protein
MIEISIDVEAGVVSVEPQGPLEKSDFARLIIANIPIGSDLLCSDAAEPRLQRGPAVDASRHLSVAHCFERSLVQAYPLLYGKCRIR